MKAQHVVSTLAGLAVLLLIPTDGFAQRGRGDTEGLARTGYQAETETLTGSLQQVKTGPCKRTTGQAYIGTHLFIKQANGEVINLHLGPEYVARDFVADLATGDQVSAQAFTTEKLKGDERIAKSVTVGEETLMLRDDALRPVWQRAQQDDRPRRGNRPRGPDRRRDLRR